jgi:hypothetical protein
MVRLLILFVLFAFTVRADVVSDSISNLVKTYCGGQTPCFLCGYDDSSGDMANLFRCDGGYNASTGSYTYSCPYNRNLCLPTYAEVECPSGGKFNPSTEKCEASQSLPPCPTQPINWRGHTVCPVVRHSDPKVYGGFNYTGTVRVPDGVNLVLGYFVELACDDDKTLYNFYVWDASVPVSCEDIEYSGFPRRSGVRCSTEEVCSKNQFGRVVCQKITKCYYKNLKSCSGPSFLYRREGRCNIDKYDYIARNVVGLTVNYVLSDDYLGSGWDHYELIFGWEMTPVCPPGYSMDSYTGICKSNPVCSKGIYDSKAKKCYLGDLTCPLGDYQCVKLADGRNYCSDRKCVDVSDSSSYNYNDPPAGGNDKEGPPVSSVTKCDGNIYIFNGKDMRCRPTGAETGFTDDCCKKTKTWFGLGSCSESEKTLSKMRSTYLNQDYNARDANCYYVGDYCVLELPFVGCVQKKNTFCCFSSPLARIIHVQGRPQLGIGWGSAKSPNCRGFTMDEFQKLDFSKIDFSEWVNMIVNGGLQQIQSQMGNTINNVINNIRNSY